ncbi:hypothetical protein VP01_197g9 [Puccinia sorghi]|uniref:NADH dehydrogenase [ubiquinone] 1 beta subcomplex subunit 11, mitochondrial n=1 Tax=Puccinia sorghi TaxID=27349 RepID=A0A0L6VBV5_9BASI|nr:hypothetical protein VP01_197g9 [Puccinia sorghi]
MASYRIPQGLKTLSNSSSSLKRALNHFPSSLLQHPSKGSLPSSVRFGSGGPHFNQPSGWLFGEKPLKPGQKRVREDWEMIWYIGFWGTTFVGIMMQIYKPDRSSYEWVTKFPQRDHQ